ncbi:hypothetical protein [Chryseobacterium paludis]|uniref:hypothetical protein n=1 Tax=Chryseobacterium paludis TaxID=2956784 RepID=UPI0021C19230|nr:hypothetical protein [Chryseobacterium paludis]
MNNTVFAGFTFMIDILNFHDFLKKTKNGIAKSKNMYTFNYNDIIQAQTFMRSNVDSGK